MYQFVRNLVKSNPWIYKVYHTVFSVALKILSIFVKTDEKLILFVVYGGQRYDDSPKDIYEYLKKEKRDYHYLWAFQNPDDIPEVSADEKIKIDTLTYFISVLRAKYWITNSSVSRGLALPETGAVKILFQHGMAGIKILGRDLKQNNKSFRNRGENFDYIVIEGKKEEEILRRAWNITDQKILNIGLPRNDELTKKTREDIEALKQKLKIPQGKKVILYAPTFREYKRGSDLEIYLKPPFDFELWNKELGEEYILLLTAHYEVAKLIDVPDMPFVINAFKYPHINEVMLVSDILISDYSSIIFDYSILGRPVISYAYDFDQYDRERGVYPGYENIFSHGIMKKQEDIIHFIKEMDYDAECEYTRKYIRDEYITNYGNATELAVGEIFGMR